MDKSIEVSLEALQKALRTSSYKPVPEGFKPVSQWALEWNKISVRRARETLSRAVLAGLAVKEKHNGLDHYKLLIKDSNKKLAK